MRSQAFACLGTIPFLAGHGSRIHKFMFGSLALALVLCKQHISRPLVERWVSYAETACSDRRGV